MSITRSQIIDKPVYNPDGEYVGKVLDIGFSLGEVKITLVVKAKWGAEVSVPWENVAAAKDIVILKEPVSAPQVSAPTPTVTPTVTTPVEKKETVTLAEEEEKEEKKGLRLPFLKKEEKEEKICPFCNKPATWIPQYRRWYCYNCRKYID